VQPVEAAGHFERYDGEFALDDHLTLVPAPGHTPGHVTVGIYSQGERAIVIGDASHHPMQLDHPDWSPSADTDPVQSAATRQRLFDAAADDGRTWIAGHWPHPGIGRILRLDGKRVFQAL
jgi:glyoxylase-like metal-dependent hydrolase (beta-lactamase superfamily II)